MRHAKLSRRGCWLPLVGLCLGLTATGVLGQNCKYDSVPATAPASRFADNGDGTVTDATAGLTWKRCSEGQSWAGATCTGTATTHSWGQAIELADGASYAGKDDWRMPSLEELASIIEKACSGPAIDLGIFPGTPAAVFWSSTPDGENADYAWYLYFSDGHGAKSHKYRAGYVRLVRGEP